MTIPTRDTLRSGINHARDKRDRIFRDIIGGLAAVPRLLVVALVLAGAYALVIGVVRLIPGFGWLLLLAFPALAYLLANVVAFWIGTQTKGRVAWNWATFRERMAEHQVEKLITVVLMVVLSTGFNLFDGAVAQEHLGADLALVIRWSTLLMLAATPLMIGALKATGTLARHYDDEAAPSPVTDREPEVLHRPRLLRKPANWDAE